MRECRGEATYSTKSCKDMFPERRARWKYNTKHRRDGYKYVVELVFIAYRYAVGCIRLLDQRGRPIVEEKLTGADVD